mgnify:CR=1 FL=1
MKPLIKALLLAATGLAFEFLKDSTEPNGDRHRVFTGHDDGLITINAEEADDPSRERARVDAFSAQHLDGAGAALAYFLVQDLTRAPQVLVLAKEFTRRPNWCTGICRMVMKVRKDVSVPTDMVPAIKGHA